MMSKFRILFSRLYRLHPLGYYVKSKKQFMFILHIRFLFLLMEAALHVMRHYVTFGPMLCLVVVFAICYRSHTHRDSRILLKYTRLELARLWISVSQEGITKHGVRSEHLKKDFSEHLKKDYSEHLKKDYSNGE